MELNKLIKCKYEDYDSWEGLRASHIHRMMRSPAHYKASLKTDKRTEALEDGKLVHQMLEDGERFLGQIVEEPIFEGLTQDGRMSTRSKEAQLRRNEWLDGLPDDAIPLKTEKFVMMAGIAKSMMSHKYVKNIIKEGDRECGLRVQDPETGLILKCRLDLITSRGHLVDFKTTRDAQPSAFVRNIHDVNKYFYALQIAHYMHCLRIAKLNKQDNAYIIAIEKEEPWGIQIYPLDTGKIDHGEWWRKKLTQTYKQCLDTDVWPGYPEKPVDYDLPEWIQIPREGA